MSTYFISDLHLDDKAPDITARFFVLLDLLVQQKASALYILGDLFEAYLGNEHPTPLVNQVACGLKHLHKMGTAIYLMHGNRDFLMHQAFAKQCSATLIPDPHVITLQDRQYLLTHGDLLCSQDWKYQLFRRLIRSKLFAWLCRMTRLETRRRVAKKLRGLSTRQQKRIDPRFLDVSPNSVNQLFDRYHVNDMIHGHTHQPKFHRHGKRLRIVLNAWYTQGGYLRIDDDTTVSFHTF
jgi:UDP-2,3-diacylglucosamine hydrolase